MVIEGDETEDGAVYCKYCDMWLNGPTQWEVHKQGKKHRKSTRYMRRMELLERERRRRGEEPLQEPPPG